MSTPAITPDQSNNTASLAGAVTSPDSFSQVPQSATAQQPTSPTAAPKTPQQPAPAQSGSRLSRIISAVANVAETALSGIPDKGRPSFVTGLGEGARAEQANIANQQAIKFRDLDSQIRIAALHHQDQELQLRTQDQQDAHQKFQDFQDDWDSDHGIVKNTIPNHGGAVVDHLTAQTAANGAATVPAGTYLSADGNSIHVPTDSSETDAGMLQKYNTFATAYGLPALPRGAQFVPQKFQDYLTHVMQGYALDGTPINHDLLPQKIATMQTQRDQLAKSNATPDQLTALDHTIGILKANQDALDSHAASVKKQSKQAELDAENSPQSIAGAAKKAGAVANAELPSKITLQDNSAANKAQAAATQLGYAYDPKNDQTVAVTADQAQAQGLTTFRKVNQTQIAADTHNSSVLNDVSSKTNAVIQSSGALDQNQRQRDIISWALGDNGIKVGFGEHLQLPMDALVNNSLNSRNMGQASDQTKNYIIGVLSLREAAMGMNRVLTGSARASETQIKALQATLPGYEADSGMAIRRLRSFAQNVDQLRKPIPVIPGVPRTPITFGQGQ